MRRALREGGADAVVALVQDGAGAIQIEPALQCGHRVGLLTAPRRIPLRFGDDVGERQLLLLAGNQVVERRLMPFALLAAKARSETGCAVLEADCGEGRERPARRVKAGQPSQEVEQHVLLHVLPLMTGPTQGAAEAPRVALSERVNDIEIGEGKLGGHPVWLLLGGYDAQKQPHDLLGRRGGMGRNGELKWPGIYSPSLNQRLMPSFG